MSIMPFSDPNHIKPLLDGRKRQTTRKPRKRPLKVGDTLYCWYRPRIKKTCDNCINNCPGLKRQFMGYAGCEFHDNKFGTAIITAITTTKIYNLSSEERELWALNDGFNSYRQAANWFEMHYGSNWEHIEWTIIRFDPDWIKPLED